MIVTERFANESRTRARCCMTDIQLTRPFRQVDLGFVALALVLGTLAIFTGDDAILAVAFLAFLLGTSTDVVSTGLERFTGGAIGSADDIDEDTGWLIGKLENVIVLVLVLVGEWVALSIVFAAKSIVRREDLSSANTTYYLAGTLLNFTYSIVIGMVARWAIGGALV